MTTPNVPLRSGTAQVEQITVTWTMPEQVAGRRRLVI